MLPLPQLLLLFWFIHWASFGTCFLNKQVTLSRFSRTDPFITENYSLARSIPPLYHWRPESDFGLPRAVGTRKSMRASILAATFPLDLLSPLMLVHRRCICDEADQDRLLSSNTNSTTRMSQLYINCCSSYPLRFWDMHSRV